jgi:cell filamentation protein
VTFDPFGDFETRGYLRNIANEKDLDIVRRLKHTSFTTGIDDSYESDSNGPQDFFSPRSQ